jgi:phosphoadenosine phosphosulfate reductase
MPIRASKASPIRHSEQGETLHATITPTQPGMPLTNSAVFTPAAASPDELQWLQAESQKLETATPQEIITWAVKNYFPKLTMATAFGPEGLVIIHMLAQIEARTPVFNLDTGYQFKETLQLRDEVARRYGIEVELKQPELSVAEFEAANGGPVYTHSPDRCCHERKITVLQQASIGMRAWMSGIRRDQSPDRARASIVGWDKKFGLVKVSPLANWTKSQVWKLITDENIPYNPLHDQGYTSIGCWPCTRAVMFGEDERAGRWSGSVKTECGLHTLSDKE